MKLDYGIICDYASVDMLGKHSYMGVFQDVSIDKKINLESLSPQFFVGVRFSELSVGKFKFKLLLNLLETNLEVGSGAFEISQEIFRTDLTVSLILPVKPVKIESPGLWKVILDIDGQKFNVSSFNLAFLQE